MSHVLKQTCSWKLKVAGLFKYVWPFCYHQALKGSISLIPKANQQPHLRLSHNLLKISCLHCVFIRKNRKSKKLVDRNTVVHIQTQDLDKQLPRNVINQIQKAHQRYWCN